LINQFVSNALSVGSSQCAAGLACAWIPVWPAVLWIGAAGCPRARWQKLSYSAFQFIQTLRTWCA